MLSHLAVLPGARRTGSGARLVRSFEQAVARAGARRAVLTTLACPEGAGPFYAGRGSTRSATHVTLDGRGLEEWTRDLAGPPAG